MNNKKRIGSIVGQTLAVVLLIAALWFFRPWFHGIAMFFYVHPLALILLLGAVLSSFLAVIFDGHFGWVSLGLVLVLSLLAYLILDPQLMQLETFNRIRYSKIDSIPEIKLARIVPKPVAERFGTDSLQEPTQKPYNWHLVLVNEKLAWVTARVPNGFWRYFLNKTNGIEIIDSEKSTRDVEFLNQEFKISEGIGIFDNIYWNLYKRRYFVDLPEILYAVMGEKVVAVIPIIAYVGFPIRTPVFDGFFMVDGDGTIEEISAKESVTHPVVKAMGRIFPEKLARFYAESYAYKLGIINKWFGHVDQIEIDDPAEDNKQPYLMSTADGLKWITVAEPYGESHAVFKIFITDAITGETSVMDFALEKSATGPAQSIGYIHQFLPLYNWADAKGGNILAIEPRPAVINKELYWMVSITTTTFKGINETCFVKAVSNEVVCLKQDNEIKNFVQGQVTTIFQSAPQTPSSEISIDERIQRLEQLLRQALLELEKMKKIKK